MGDRSANACGASERFVLMAQVCTSRRKPRFECGVSFVTALQLLSVFDVDITFPVPQTVFFAICLISRQKDRAGLCV